MRLALFIGVVWLWLVAIVALPARAQEPAGAATGGEPPSDIGVSLLPRDDGEPLSYFLYSLAPGGSAEDRLVVHNYSKQSQKIQIYATDGSNSPDGGLSGPLFGTPSLVMGKWVTLSESELLLRPNEEKTVAVRLKVPAEAEVKDYFGFVFVQPDSTATANSTASQGKVSFAIKVQTRYGIALVTRVPGPSREELSLSPPQKSFQQGKIVLSFDASNSGNRYLKPKGSWKLLDPKGEQVLSNPTDAWGYILPGSKLTWNIPLQTSRPLVRGKYLLVVEATFGTPAQTRQEQFPVDLP